MANDRTSDIKKNISEKSNFFFQLRQSGRQHICNWTLYLSLIIAVLLGFVIELTKGQKVFNQHVVTISSDMIGTAISALGIILAAVAVTVVLYSRRSLHSMVEDKSIMSGLLFPYRYIAFLWAMIGILSFLGQLVEINLSLFVCTIINWMYCFLIMYAIIYFMYIISEVVQHVITSAYVEKFDENN